MVTNPDTPATSFPSQPEPASPQWQRSSFADSRRFSRFFAPLVSDSILVICRPCPHRGAARVNVNQRGCQSQVQKAKFPSRLRRAALP